MSVNIRWMLWMAALAALVTVTGCGGEKAAAAKQGAGAPADTALLAADDVARVTTPDVSAGIFPIP